MVVINGRIRAVASRLSLLVRIRAKGATSLLAWGIAPGNWRPCEPAPNTRGVGVGRSIALCLTQTTQRLARISALC